MAGDKLPAFGEAGWRVGMNGFAARPSSRANAGLTAMHIQTAAYTEWGGAAALTGASQGYDYAATMLGVRAEATLFSNFPLLARGMLGWRHVFGDVTPDATLAFDSAPAIPFTIAGAPIARDRGRLRLEADEQRHRRRLPFRRTRQWRRGQRDQGRGVHVRVAGWRRRR
jgi:uncharacterized protein with beta-barrel porin domain